MKKFFYYMVGITVVVAISLASVEVYAGWELYDDFNSGVIDTTRWDIDESSATIIPVFGAVGFVHNPGFPRDSSWLSFKQSPETIKAVLVTVMVQSCTGDVHGRIGGWNGKVGGDYVWNHFSLRASEERIAGGLVLLEAGTFDWLYDLYWAMFKYPLDIIGNPFTIATTFSDPQNVTYYAAGLGLHTIKIFETVSPTDDHFKGIGTRSETARV
jgi:hypothetical protein